MEIMKRSWIETLDDGQDLIVTIIGFDGCEIELKD